MERRGRLTYERLCNSFERLHDAIEVQFPDHKDRARAQNLQRVIDEALTSARAGMSGAVFASPFQLKREVEARIVEVHERHNEVDEREEQVAGTATVDVKSSDMQSSALSGLHASPNHTTQKTPAPRRSSRSPDSGKENTTPSTAASQQVPTKKPPAVKKTTITKRAASKKPSSTASVKKRTTTPRTRNNTNPLPPTTDEADRRAAATALLGLSSHSPPLSLAAPPSPHTTPPPRAKKRTHAAHQDERAVSPPRRLRTEMDMSAPAAKRRSVAANYAPVPRLEGVVARKAFLMGVRYAEECFSAVALVRGEGGGVGVSRFVGRELGMVVCSGADAGAGAGAGAGGVDAEGGGAVVGDGRADSQRSGARSAGKGFWDVV